MKRVLIVALGGVLTFGAVYGFAASLNLTTDSLGAVDTTVAACQAGALTATYTSSYSSTVPGYAVGTVTVTEPPPLGTAALPLLDVRRLLTVTWSVALPQPDGRLLTVTLMTVAAERFWITPSPAAVQRGVPIAAMPNDWLVAASDAANAAAPPAARRTATRMVLRGRTISCSWKCPAATVCRGRRREGT